MVKKDFLWNNKVFIHMKLSTIDKISKNWENDELKKIIRKLTKIDKENQQKVIFQTNWCQDKLQKSIFDHYNEVIFFGIQNFWKEVVRCCVTTTLALETFSLLSLYLNYKFGLRHLSNLYLFFCLFKLSDFSLVQYVVGRGLSYVCL